MAISPLISLNREKIVSHMIHPIENYCACSRRGIVCQGQFKIYPQTRMEVETHYMWPLRAHKLSTALCTKKSYNQMSYNRYLLNWILFTRLWNVDWTPPMEKSGSSWGSVTFELFKLVVFNFSHPNCWWKLLFPMTTNRRGNTIYKAMNSKR